MVDDPHGFCLCIAWFLDCYDQRISTIAVYIRAVLDSWAMQLSLLVAVVGLLPKKLCSYLLGLLVNLRVPRFLARMSVRWFARHYSIDLSAANQALSEYDCIGSFFVRNLKSEVRPIGIEPTSPVDGILRSYGMVRAGMLSHVKGATYSIDAFLRETGLASKYHAGFYLNFYLSPRDCHHVFSPVDGAVVAVHHIPGTLWPVNDWASKNVSQLYCVNERVVIDLNTSQGPLLLVMVGALNVGQIQVSFDCGVVTNGTLLDAIGLGRKISSVRYADPHVVRSGERVGTFFMGSSVVVLFSQRPEFATENDEFVEKQVQYGQSLVELIDPICAAR